MRRIEGKIELKMVVPEVVETRATIKFCVKLGYEPTEMFYLLQRGGDALEMKTVQCLSGTRGFHTQKSVRDGPMSGCRKIISGKLVTHYERRCLRSFPNMTRLGTRHNPKMG